MWCRPTLFSIAREFWHGGEDDVSSRQSQKEGWQAASLFQCSGEPPRGAEQDGAADGVVSGEINDNQEAIWRKTLQVFDETHQQYTTLSLFPEDREIPAILDWHRLFDLPACKI